MRKKSTIQLSLFLLIAWGFGTSILAIAIYVVHGEIDHDHTVILLVTSLGTGGFMWQMLDVWEYIDRRCAQKRANNASQSQYVASTRG